MTADAVATARRLLANPFGVAVPTERGGYSVPSRSETEFRGQVAFPNKSLYLFSVKGAAVISTSSWRGFGQHLHVAEY